MIKAESGTSRVELTEESLNPRQGLWFATMVGGLSLWVALPWVAPLLMELGWETPARILYRFYSFQCHQLPQRSFFIFGDQTMYGLGNLAAAGVDTTDPWALRQFLGSPNFGYKLAWTDRMVSMYTSLPLAALVWCPLRRRLKLLSWWGLLLFLLPMVLDGGTHIMSDLQGLDRAFAIPMNG